MSNAAYSASRETRWSSTETPVATLGRPEPSTAARTRSPALCLRVAIPRVRVPQSQNAAAHESAVPAAVLEAASAITIAVVDTGADGVAAAVSRPLTLRV